MKILIAWFMALGAGQKIGLIGTAVFLITGLWPLAIVSFVVFSISRAVDLSKSQKAQVAAASPGSANPAATAQAMLLPDEQKVFVRGVGYRQGELESLGIGTIHALLLPEPTNEYDENAVMVCSGIPSAYVHFGYLPKDFEITPMIGTLAEVVRERDGVLLAARCEIEQKADHSWIATVFLPHETTVDEMIG